MTSVSLSDSVTGFLCASRGRWYATGALIVLTGVVLEFLSPVWPDTAWFLLAAERLLHGSRLYSDVIDMNPPLIVWLDTIPVALAQAVGASPVAVFRVMVVALLLCSVTLCNVLLARLMTPDGLRRRCLVLLLLVVLFLLPRVDDFGQREHLLLALILPYLVLVACRAAGKPVAPGLAAVVAAAAGIGLAIKPFFALVWVALSSWQWLTLRSAGTRLTPEALMTGIVLLLYPLAVVAWAPEYFEFVRAFAPSYSVYAGYTSLALLGLTMVELAAYLALRSKLPAPHLWDTIAIAAAAALLAAALQRNGWRYHFYPALSLSTLLVGGLTLEVRRHKLASRTQHFAALLALAGLLTVLTEIGWKGAQSAANGLTWQRSFLGHLIEWTRGQQHEHRLLMIDEGWLEAGVAAHSGKIPVSRVNALFPVRAAYANVPEGSEPHYHEPDSMGFAERKVFTMTRDDFLRGDPVLLLVPLPSRGFDDIAYFMRDSSFAQLFRHYTFVGTIEGRHAFRRIRSGEVRMLRPEAPVPVTDAEPSSPLARLGISGLRAPVFAGLLLVLWYVDYRKRRRLIRKPAA
jgi:hypothetical protein